MMNANTQKSPHELFVSILKKSKSKLGSFNELQEFRTTVPLRSHKDTLYTQSKGRVLTYRITFALLSLFFVALTAFIYQRVPTTFAHTLFGDIMGLRYPLMSLTVSFASLTGYFGWNMQTEKEVLHQIFHRAKKKLKERWNHTRSERGILSRFPLTTEGNQLYQKYRDLEERMEKLRKEQESLLQCIRFARHVSGTLREKLYNQALREFELNTHKILEGL